MITWLLAILSAVLVAASIPIDGLAGIALAVAGVLAAIGSMCTNPACKGRAKR